MMVMMRIIKRNRTIRQITSIVMIMNTVTIKNRMEKLLAKAKIMMIMMIMTIKRQRAEMNEEESSIQSIVE